ncbi:MAG: DUF305 domain-containing protein [Hyphomicrobiaceae bacterium]|nr:DUF305 domain-containing protein [Hyphomicrobiaceae bacterium]
MHLSRTFALLTGVGAALLVAAGALAQSSHDGHHGHHGHHAAAMPGNEAVVAFEAVNKKMHEAMAIEFTGDADTDFVRGMIPHHQGAVDMAEVVLKHGKDPEIRKLAEEIIKAQEGEIAFMKAWLASRAKP